MGAYIINYATYVGFTAEIFAAEYIFSLKYIRRPHFYRRLTGSFFAQLLLAFMVGSLLVRLSPQSLPEHMLEKVLTYLSLTAASYAGLRFCYEENRSVLLLCVTTGYAVQHLQSQLGLLLWANINRSDSPYYWWLESRLLLVVVYGLAYCLVARRANEAESLRLANRNVVFFSVATIVMVLVLSCVRDYYQDESFSLTVVSRLFSIGCCIFLLLIRGGFLEQSKLEREVETIRRLHYKEREQYEQSRRNIELVNVKCHDLKKRLEQYEDRMIGLSPEELSEIKNAVSIYDSAVQTGNDTLDTILTERSLVCEREGITFSCIADGACLDFLSVGDTYSLFANAVDNAIEAVLQLPEREERIISLSVRKKLGMAAVAVDNSCDASRLVFEDGLPKTTKPDGQYHGYGMKSIRMIAEKYGGEMTVRADGMFHLAVLLPIPE